MKKKNSIAVTIASCMIAAGLFLAVWILPFLYIFIADIEHGQSHVRNLKWDKLAVKYSIFKSQKTYTFPIAIMSFNMAKDYDSVIEYSKELERIGALTDADKYFISKAYLEKDDYENALKYAADKPQQIRVYIKMNDLPKAKALINVLLNEKPIQPNTYLYKSEIELASGNWKEADIWVDKILEINPKHLQALKIKAKILKHFGKNSEYELYMQKIKKIEDMYNGMVITK